MSITFQNKRRGRSPQLLIITFLLFWGKDISVTFLFKKKLAKLYSYSLRIGFKSRFGQGLGQTLGI
jgi:hypothetical protein